MTAIIILSVLLTIAICGLIACYFIINIQTDKIKYYETWIEDFDDRITQTYKKMREIDNMQIFQKDDDVGFAFNSILEIIESLKDKLK